MDAQWNLQTPVFVTLLLFIYATIFRAARLFAGEFIWPHLPVQQ